MIGDTDFFIDLMHPRRQFHDRAAEKAQDLADREVRLGMTAVTRFELATGIQQAARREEEREAVHRLLQAYPTHPLEGAAADQGGRIHGSLQAQGTPVGVMDVLIAAVAFARGEPLLTRNRRDFGRIPGLALETY